MNMQQRSALEGPCNIIEGFGEYYCSQQELETMAELFANLTAHGDLRRALVAECLIWKYSTARFHIGPDVTFQGPVT